MAAGDGKFKRMMGDINEELNKLHNRAIQQALNAGLAAAILSTVDGETSTVHDSSNAAVHWQVVPASGAPRAPWSRLRDLRERKGRGKKKKGKRKSRLEGVVGMKGDAGRFKHAASRYVRKRERDEVLARYISGKFPERKFYFYNAVIKDDEYAENANIEAAGEAAVSAAWRAVERAYLAGMVRSKFRK